MAGRSLFDLSGRVAVITGASRGIGRAVAEGLADAGADVALVSRTEAELDQCADAVRSRGGRASVFVADLARTSDIEPLVQRILAQLGQIDILVNSIAVTHRKPAVEVSEADWDEILTVDVKAVFFTCQAVGRYWIETRRFSSETARGKGKIINLASITSLLGTSGVAPYVTSKHAVLGLTRALAMEWAGAGVCVNSIAPGYTETPLVRPLFENPTFTSWLEANVPMGRGGYPADIVGTAVYLAAPASDYLTGQMIPVDGGFTAGYVLPPGD